MDSMEKNENICNETNVRNVSELKKFFQDKNFPIMGLQHKNDNCLDTNSVESSDVESNRSRKESVESITSSGPIRPNRAIPRPPPRDIQSSDINVSSLLKALPTIERERPVPKPRRLKSGQNYKTTINISTNCDNDVNKDVNKESVICDANQRSNSLTLSTIKELKELSLNGRHLKSHSIHSLPQHLLISANNQNISSQTYCAQNIGQKVIHSNSQSISDNCVTTDKQSSSKSKKPFKSFLKRSKLLSLRKKSVENKKQKFKLFATNSDPSNATQLRPLPVRPTRTPPLPPLLHFRPAAPLPPESSEDYYEDTLTATHSNNNNYNQYELYNDSVDSEQIYCSVDNDDESGSDFYEGIDDYDDGLAGNKHFYNTDNYYEDSIDNINSDCDRIYEVLPFERDIQTDSESNASIISLEEKPIDSESAALAQKRELKAVKLKKKFNLTGEEVPVNAGIVKEDDRGSRYDLFVRKGETVLILRMEGNPPGKWLAKNERSKVGFVDLANISFDAESVKCIIKTLAPHKP